MKTPGTHTFYRVRYNDSQPIAWDPLDNIPADVVFVFLERTETSFPKSHFGR